MLGEITESTAPATTNSLSAIGLRQDGILPEDSEWLAAMPGLAETAAAWSHDLGPVRAAIPARVDELLSPHGRWQRAARNAHVVRVFGRAGLGAALVDGTKAATTRQFYGPLAAHRLRKAFERLGPSYIKLGQFISSGRGLFPDVLVDEFAACRDRCPQLPEKLVRQAVEAELGPIEEVFAFFDPVPMAAASIAQVHAAVLRDGRDMVVKVQRPGIAAEVAAHIRTMPALARLVDRAFPKAPVADPMAVVRLFATTIHEELDFRLEAQNMVDIALDLEAAGVDDVVVPHPVPGLVTPRVLVMERLRGARFDDLEDMQAAGINTTTLLVSGLRSLIEGATVFGRFHGDLHAGNVIAMPDGRFGLVDFGICARLDAAGRAGLQKLLVGMSTGEVRAHVHGLDVLGALPETTDRRMLIARLLAEQREDRTEVTVDDLAEGVPRIMSVFTEHKLHLPPALVLFFKDVLYLNGSVRLLAPGIDVFGLFGALHGHFESKYGADRVVLGDDPYGGPITDEERAAAAPVDEPAGRPEPPTLKTLARRFGPEMIPSVVVPMLIFLGLDTTLGLVPAIAGVTLWTVVLTVVRRARGKGSPLAWVVLAFTVLRGLSGVLTGSGAVYFGPDVANNFIIGTALLASAAVGKPAIGYVARIFYPFPPAVRRHPTFLRVFRRLTLAWAGWQLGFGVVQAWLLVNADPSTFVLVKRLVGLPVGVILFVISLRYPRRVFENDPEIVALVEGTAR